MGLKRSFKLTNELNYDIDTYTEWTIAGTGTTKGITGIHLVQDPSNGYALLSTNLKTDTKYGLLYSVYESTLDNYFIILQSGAALDLSDIVTSAVILNKTTGNNKATFTTRSSIPKNTLAFVNVVANTNGTYINFGNVRLFELPTGSQIETDFTNLTADQLSQLYPWFRYNLSISGKFGGSIGLR